MLYIKSYYYYNLLHQHHCYYYLFSLELSCSIALMEEVSEVTYLQTRPGDNGTRPEGGRACSTVRSNLRKLNKSWPCRRFIMQHLGLLSCAVTEPGGAPLGMNSQGIAYDLSWQIRLYRSFYICRQYSLWTRCSCVQVFFRTRTMSPTNHFHSKKF